MKFPQRRMVHPEDAAEYVGGPKVLTALLNDGWIAPVLKGNRITLYDLKQLDAACDRMTLELPPSLRKEKAAA